MFIAGRVFVFALLAILINGCAAFRDPGSRWGGRIIVVWVGEDRFIYVPSETYPFRFEYGSRILQPGLMYTDGGSVPRFAQALRGLSSWAYGPAYIIHDWMFYAHQCHHVTPSRFRARSVSSNDHVGDDVLTFRNFQDTQEVLHSAIVTMEDYGMIRIDAFARAAVTAAVGTTIAQQIWNRGDECRISPEHLSAVFKIFGICKPEFVPASWKIPPEEIFAAFKIHHSTEIDFNDHGSGNVTECKWLKRTPRRLARFSAKQSVNAPFD